VTKEMLAQSVLTALRVSKARLAHKVQLVLMALTVLKVHKALPALVLRSKVACQLSQICLLPPHKAIRISLTKMVMLGHGLMLTQHL
jgi:hypothetical protein